MSEDTSGAPALRVCDLISSLAQVEDAIRQSTPADGADPSHPECPELARLLERGDDIIRKLRRLSRG